MEGLLATRLAQDPDHAALAAACEPGVGLATIVGIDGSFSRRIGAQLAVRPDGTTVGSLADGCLEAQIAADMRSASEPVVLRYGRGSPKIDFRLPCGGGLEILLDPAPDRAACRSAMDSLDSRRATRLECPDGFVRSYLPALRIVALGEGPELAALEALGGAMGTEMLVQDKAELELGKPASRAGFDRWTACLLLFHDHEWELPLLEQALASEAFFIGAQGGEKARADRCLALAARNVPEEQVARIVSPIGLIPACKSPETLALSALSQIVAEHEQLRESP